MEPRMSQRKPKPTTIWEQKGAPSAAKDPKVTKKTARTEKKTALSQYPNQRSSQYTLSADYSAIEAL
jgi:hypothetical protein